MTLQNNYNFNKITKSQTFLGLLKKSNKSFSVNLLNQNPLNLKVMDFNTQLNAKAANSIKETETFNKNIKKQIQGLSLFNWSRFVYTKRLSNSKKIQTKFRSIISDQKKRIAFDNHELIGNLLKSLLCVGFSSKPQLHQLEIHFNPILNSLKNSPYIGAGLILEQSINQQYNKKQGISNIRNRCIVTGRNSIIGKFRLSRISFRRYAGQGLIPGLIKKSH
uniref:Ribosomal protein S14 n=2 Tax=Ulva prolifera TaxID=3117 RepID=A0A0U2I094_ULVPR|nr:ribosomal protein S14 [Ulva prolifera]ALN38246.1 ribosomal protein S14 [Ulva prolifera]QZJ45939.1 ribosomal protein S14 [Ulva prolifera]